MLRKRDAFIFNFRSLGFSSANVQNCWGFQCIIVLFLIADKSIAGKHDTIHLTLSVLRWHILIALEKEKHPGSYGYLQNLF